MYFGWKWRERNFDLARRPQAEAWPFVVQSTRTLTAALYIHRYIDSEAKLNVTSKQGRSEHTAHHDCDCRQTSG